MMQRKSATGVPLNVIIPMGGSSAAFAREGYVAPVPLLRIIALVIAAIGLVLLVYGAQLCWAVRGNVVPSLGVSRAVAYVPLPVSGLLMTWFALPQLLTGRHPADDASEGERG